jgi:hypothetical protein
VTAQIESVHYYRSGDTVRRRDGRSGVVTEGRTLYAIVTWDDGASEEVNQFDPSIAVETRSGPDSR